MVILTFKGVFWVWFCLMKVTFTFIRVFFGLWGFAVFFCSFLANFVMDKSTETGKDGSTLLQLLWIPFLIVSSGFLAAFPVVFFFLVSFFHHFSTSLR